MIKIIRSNERYQADLGWLKTRWHFSFDHYYDPANLSWGPLRVFNHDVVDPGRGFDWHSHRDMEIVTYVLAGELEHRDSLGHTGVIEPGEVQVMSAGTGITHSEYNHSPDKPLHLLQLWLLPRQKGREPRWEQRRFSRADRTGRLLPVVSGSRPGTLAIDQDATIYVSVLAAGQSVGHESQPQRRAYLFVIDGRTQLNEQTLAAGDQARMANEPRLNLEAQQDSELILLDLP